MKNNIPETTLVALRENLHALIRHRIGEFLITENPELPSLDLIKKSFESEIWFPINGMCGGFSLSLVFDEDNHKYQLISESWSRVVGGSGQRHIITINGCELNEDGIV